MLQKQTITMKMVKKMKSQKNLIVTNKNGALKNGVFIGSFKAEVKEGILFGKMTGKRTGYKIEASTMRRYW